MVGEQGITHGAPYWNFKYSSYTDIKVPLVYAFNIPNSLGGHIQGGIHNSVLNARAEQANLTRLPNPWLITGWGKSLKRYINSKRGSKFNN